MPQTRDAFRDLWRAIAEGIRDVPGLIRRRWLTYAIFTVLSTGIGFLQLRWQAAAPLALIVNIATSCVVYVDVMRLRNPSFRITGAFIARGLGVAMVWLAVCVVLVLFLAIIGMRVPGSTVALYFVFWLVIFLLHTRYQFTWLLIAEAHLEKNPFFVSWILTSGSMTLPTIVLVFCMYVTSWIFVAFTLLPHVAYAAVNVATIVGWYGAYLAISARWMATCERSLGRRQLASLAELRLSSPAEP